MNRKSMVKSTLWRKNSLLFLTNALREKLERTTFEVVRKDYENIKATTSENRLDSLALKDEHFITITTNLI